MITTPLGLQLEVILRRIDAGEVSPILINPSTCPEEREQKNGIPFCGYPTYKAEGWTFCVFDDCYEWDYFEWIETPEGTRLEFPSEGKDWAEYPHELRILQSYRPYCVAQWHYTGDCYGCEIGKHDPMRWDNVRNPEEIKWDPEDYEPIDVDSFIAMILTPTPLIEAMKKLK